MLIDRRRIVHLTTFLQGGAGRALADLALAQSEAGHDVTVVASASGEDGYGNYAEYLQRLDEGGVAILLRDSLFKRDYALNLQVLQALRELVPAEHLDILHAHAAVPALGALLYSRRAGGLVPVVQTMHGWGSRKTAEQEAADLAILREVDRVIATSRASARWMVGQGIGPERIAVIPCGLRETGGLKPCATGDRLHALRSQGVRILMCIGSVTANKNQRLLVVAIPYLKNRNDIIAVFVGEGGEALEALAESHGVSSKVLCLGYQPHADALLAEADLLVMPSLNEGQGLAVLEAFRAGVPVVASDIPALVELVSDRETGVTFRSNDAPALAAAIERVLDLAPPDRSRLVRAARARFEATYTLPQMVEAHENLYRELYPRVGSCP